ncbi:MAG: hypothetical protein R2752_13485 [Vicinamibacterales bacterium]
MPGSENSAAAIMDGTIQGLMGTAGWVRGLVFVLAVAGGSACGQPPNAGLPSPSAPSPPRAITQVLHGRSSDGRNLGTIELPAFEGIPIEINPRALAAIHGLVLDNVNPDFFVVRESAADGLLGRRLVASLAGSAYMLPTEQPAALWLMNSSNGADYVCAANTPGFLLNGPNPLPRYATARPLTTSNNTVADFIVVDGSPSDIVLGLDWLNDAWVVDGLQLAEIRWTNDPAEPADINGGLGTHQVTASAGYHSGNSFVVRPGQTTLRAAGIAASEALEVLLQYDDLCGMDTNSSLLTLGVSNSLSARGKDLVRFGVLMKELR